LTENLAARIAVSGPIPFPEFMAAALYDPLRGYYARESRKVGRDGDFFTSVSVGPVFGALLARRVLDWWTTAGKPAKWRVIELGAHDGALAEDILTALRGLDPGALESLEYAIIEPLPALADAQRERLSGFQETLTFATTLEELDARPGLAFGNELVDALPFHVIEWHQGDWSECHVGWADGTFKWCPGQPLCPETVDAVKSLVGPFPEGYRSEVRSGFPELLGSLARSLETGMVLWIDYGFARPDYYTPARSTGTLRTFSKHQAGEDPLADPGERDITAHVDFTHLAEAALAHGLVPTCFSSQGSWLTRLAAPWLREMESRPDPAAIRQFQTLTHPSHLGARFHVLEMALNEAVDPVAAASTLQRLALTGNFQP
jgi:SAM-dependent MidA family methyltransferase